MPIMGRIRFSQTALTLLLLSVLIFTLTPTAPARAATYTVSKTADTNDGTCNADCSLREAVVAANASAGSDTINLSVSGTYTLTSEISVTSDITIQESAGITATIDGGGTNRLFNVSTASGALTLTGLTLQNGSTTTAGGCIQVGASSGGSLTFTSGTLQNCTTTNSGGAVGTSGGTHSITISSSTLQNNIAGINGGAISQTGTASDLSVNNTTFTNNRGGSASNAQGGAIVFAGQGAAGASFNITNSTFTNNRAQSSNTLARGGAIHFTASDATLTGTISGSTFSSNQALNGSTENRGGAIYKSGIGSLSISGSVFTGNSSTAEGGAFFSNQGNLSITSSRIETNSATSSGGAYYSVSGGTDSLTGSCIVSNSDTAVVDTEVGNDTTATGNWWGTSSGPQIVGAGGNSAASIGDSISGDGVGAAGDSIADVHVALTNPNSNPPTGNWLTSAPTVAGAACIDLSPVTLPDVTISTASFNVNEGANANFTITRTGSTTSSLAVTVNIAQGIGTVVADYTLSGGSISAQSGNGVTVTIPAGSASVNVNLAATDDVSAEADNTLTLALVDGAAYNLGAPTSSIATIPANDLVVTTLNDSGDGSLRQAMTNANAFASNDTITFTAAANGTITPLSDLPGITGTLTIDGNGPASTIISGNDARRVLTQVSGSLTLSDLTLRDGNAIGDVAGAIYGGGALTVTNAHFIDNVAQQDGGAIYVAGTSLNVTNSIFHGNTSGDDGGAILYDNATGSVTNSLFYDNEAQNTSGAIGLHNPGTNVTITNTTISDNTAPNGALTISNAGTGTLRNSIVANTTGTNGDIGNFSGGTFNVQNSLIEEGLGEVNGTNTNNLSGDPALNGSYQLTSSSPAINAGNNSLIPAGVTTDLAGNARIQQTTVDMGAYESAFSPALPDVAITPASFNVNEGANTNFTISRTGSTASSLVVTVNITQGIGTVAADYTLSGGSVSGQNGSQTVTIPAGNASVNVNFAATDDVDAEGSNSLTMALVDTAAYNLGATTSSTATIPTNDTVVTNTGNTGDGTLRQAIDNANFFSGPDTISFTVAANGTILLGAPLSDITSTITIDGPGAGLLTITGLNLSNAFHVAAAGNLTLNAVTVSGLNGVMDGAGIRNLGTVTVNDSRFVNNTGMNGGAIRNDNILIVNRSRFSGNSALTNGGAIYSSGGTVTITNSSFSGNTPSDNGGALYGASGSTWTINNSTLSGNGATDNGGNIYFAGTTLTLNNTIVANSTDGGECFRFSGTINARNSLIEGGLTCVNGTNTNNLTDDPALNGDLTLTSSSVAVDAGNDSLIPAGVTTDLAGNGRTQGTRVDMGAYESAFSVPLPQLSINDVSLNEGSSGTTNFTFTVSLSSNARGVPVTFNIATADGTAQDDVPATEDNDYVAKSLTSQTIPVGSNSYTFTVLVNGDTVVEPNETFFVNVTSVTGATITDGQGQGTIVNDDAAPLPNVTIDPGTLLITEGANGDFTITRTGSTTSSLIIMVNITLGTGMVDADYDLSGGGITGQVGSQTVTIPAGQASVNVNFSAIAQLEAEASNELTIEIVDGANYNLGVNSTSIARILASDTIVTNTNNSGDGSLRQAITNANAFSGNDIITFTAGANGTITLGSNLPNPALNGTLTITGNGTANTIISGNDAFRGLFTTSVDGLVITVQNLQVTNGFVAGTGFGGAIDFDSAGGTLTLNNVLLTNGEAGYGGAINADDGTVIVNNSIISNNTAHTVNGGIWSGITATVRLTNTLMTGNSGPGGALFNNGGTLNIYNSTIVGNTASASYGAGVDSNGGTLVIYNSILANNTGSSGDCDSNVPASGTITVQNTLIKDGSCDIADGVNGNVIADPALNGDYTLSNVSVAINAGNNSLIPAGVTTDLAGNARIQQTTVDMGAYESAFTAVLPNVTISPAAFNVNEGANTNFTITRTGSTTNSLVVTVNITQGVGTTVADYTLSGGSITGQTGTQVVNISAGQASVNVQIAATDDVSAEANNTLTVALVDGSAYNLGATTSSVATIPQNDLVVTTLNDSGDGSLRQAVLNADAFLTNDTITFTVSGTITLTSSLEFAFATTSNVTINGGGNITLNGDFVGPVIKAYFNDLNSTQFVYDGLTITHAAGRAGGAIQGQYANVTVRNSTITGNNGVNDGGGIEQNRGDLIIENSTFSNNVSNGDGGAVNAGGGTGTITIRDSIFTNNTSVGFGGALYLNVDEIHIVGSQFTNNSSAGRGGAIYAQNADMVMTNSLIAGNTTSNENGALNTNSGTGTTTINNSTISGNLGGGFVLAGSTSTINNSIIANTLSGADCSGGSAIVQNSLIEDGSCGITNGVNGNIVAAPVLNGDYSLSSSSPAVNAGSNALIPAGVTTDLAGNARIQQTTVDMGAYESAFTPALPDVTITPAAFNVSEGANANFTITRTGSTASALAVTVNITQGSGTVAADYTLSGGSISGQSGNGVTVTIPAGSASVNVQIAAVNDAVDEANETLAITLVDGAAYNLGATTVSTATIVDNDAAGVTVNPTSGLVTTEAGGTAQFTVVLNTQPTADVTIGISSSDTTEGTPNPTSLTFTSGNWNVARTVTITGVDDLIVDGSILYTIITTAATSADSNYSGMVVADVSITNSDNDTAGITVNPTNGLVTTEAGGTAQFTVVLNTQPTADVTIGISSSDTTEGTPNPTSLTFTSGNWNVARTVTVTGVNDSIVDGNIAYTIVTTAATSTDPNYNNMAVADVSVTNNDTTVLTSLTIQLTLQARPTAPNTAYVVSGEVEVRPVGGGAPVLDTTFTSDNQGRFTLTNIPVGTYNIWVKGSHTLARLQNFTLVVGGSTMTTALLLEGDANNDNFIDVLDFSALSAAFGTLVGDAAYDARADFNQDGVVSLVDFSLLANSFSVEGDP